MLHQRDSVVQAPPQDSLRAARQAAQRLGPGRSVYLYCEGDDWLIARRPAEIPAGAPALQVFADPDNPELGNKGGC